MSSIVLRRPDVSLFRDPVGTRVELPRMTALSRQVEERAALPLFDGYDDPLLVRGVLGVRRTVDLSVSFFRPEHGQLVELLGLLERLRADTDGRLMVRSVTSDTSGIDPLLVVGVTGWTHTASRSGVRTVSLSCQQAHYRLGVG